MKLLGGLVLIVLMTSIPPVTGSQSIVITLLSPYSSSSRTYAAISFTREGFTSGGISIRNLVMTGWDVLAPRTFLYPAGSSGIPTYDKGGYDIVMLGLAESPLADPLQSYSTDFLSPDGLNFAWYANDQVDNLTRQYYAQFDPQLRAGIAKQIQMVINDDLPYIPLFSLNDTWWSQSSLQLNIDDIFNLQYLDNGEVWFDLLGQTADHQLVYISNQESDTLFPTIQSPDFKYGFTEATMTNMVFSGLFERDTKTKEFTPVLAQPAEINRSTVELSVNSTATFSNGHKVTAWDVVNSYRLFLADTLADQDNSVLLRRQLDMSRGMQSVVLTKHNTIKFYFNTTHIENMKALSLPVFDDAVIGNYSSGATVIYDDGSSQNLGSGPAVPDYNYNNDPQTFCIGTGPFVYSSINASSNNYVLKATPNYWRGGIGAATINFDYVRDQRTAVDMMEAGIADLADARFFITSNLISQTHLQSFSITGGAQQFLAINMNHPLLGTGVDTPLGQAHPDRAAEAARYIRKALAYLIPYDEMISSIQPNATHTMSLWNPDSPEYYSGSKAYNYSENIAQEYLTKAGYDALTLVTSFSDTTTTSSSTSQSTTTIAGSPDSTMHNSDSMNLPVPFYQMMMLLAILGYAKRKSTTKRTS